MEILDAKRYISEELARLSKKYGIPVPTWTIIPGDVSYFDHGDQIIRFGETVLMNVDKEGVQYLVDHEFRHWWQYKNEKLQSFSTMREIDAHRNAMDEITGRQKVFPIFTSRPTPFLDAFVNDIDKSKFPIRDHCGTCKSHLLLRFKREVKP